MLDHGHRSFSCSFFVFDPKRRARGNFYPGKTILKGCNHPNKDRLLRELLISIIQAG